MAVGYITPRHASGHLRAEGRRYGRLSAVGRRRSVKNILALITLFLLVVVAAVLTRVLLRLNALAARLPSVAVLESPKTAAATTILSSDGVPLAVMESRYHRPVALSSISRYLVDATIATEDARFYEHHGIDPRGILRAVMADVQPGRSTSQGASTITQQLARNLYLSNEKSLDRKIEEALLARRIEAAHSKQEILEAYLNTVYYGSGAYGAEAASEIYFGKHARDLTLGEAALLAGLPQRPAALAPNRHLPQALARREEVLDRMLATGKISADQRREASSARVRILPPRRPSMADWKAPYFVAHVLEILKQQFGPDFQFSGAQVVTTLNWGMQQAAERALRDGLHRRWGPNTGALVAIDPHTGYVRALVGGPDFQRDQFDAAVDGARQPGSAFKLFDYLAAFDSGQYNLLTPVDDQRLVFPMKPRDWVVHNYDGAYHGPMTVLDAIRHSINTVAVQVTDNVGPTLVADYAERLGISTPLTPGLPLALGASAVRPIDLCSAYSALANRGDRYDPTFLIRVTDADGHVLYSDDTSQRHHQTFLDGQTVDQMNVALREVATTGTGAAAGAIPDAHGKTGTTSSHRDAWFVGYTGELATAIWVAHTTRASGRQVGVAVSYAPMPGETGGKLCAPIWRDFMRVAGPIQRRADVARGEPVGPVPAPTPAQLIAQLTQQAQQQQQAAQQDQQQEQTAEGVPPGFAVAQNGSGPLRVTAPDPQAGEADTASQQTAVTEVIVPANGRTARIVRLHRTPVNGAQDDLYTDSPADHYRTPPESDAEPATGGDRGN